MIRLWQREKIVAGRGWGEAAAVLCGAALFVTALPPDQVLLRAAAPGPMLMLTAAVAAAGTDAFISEDLAGGAVLRMLRVTDQGSLLLRLALARWLRLWPAIFVAALLPVFAGEGFTILMQSLPASAAVAAITTLLTSVPAAAGGRGLLPVAAVLPAAVPAVIFAGAAVSTASSPDTVRQAFLLLAALCCFAALLCFVLGGHALRRTLADV